MSDVNRLVDMVVEEVSLVDRAANKHRFLIVKRSEGPMVATKKDSAPQEPEEAASDDVSTEAGEDESQEPAEAQDLNEEADEADVSADEDVASRPTSPEPLAAILAAVMDLKARMDGETSAPKKKTAPPAVAATPNPDVATALTEITSALKGLNARLSRVEKSTGLPASQRSEPRTETTPGSVSWPLDLNAPHDRANVSKDLSFHDG